MQATWCCFLPQLSIPMVIIRIWWGVVIVLNALQMKIMDVTLNEVIGTDVVEICHLLSRVLAQTKNDSLGFI